MTDALKNAGLLIARNIPVAPADGKQTLLDAASCDTADLVHWSRVFPGSDFVVVCGRGSGIVVLDIREDRFAGIAHEYPSLPPTWQVKRESNFTHHWFASPAGFGGLPNRAFHGTLELRRHAPVPGSRRDGLTYEWSEGHSPVDLPISDLPRDWALALRAAARKPRIKEPVVSAEAPAQFDKNKVGHWTFDDDDY